ncbi:MAG: Non-classical phosphatidylinositol transfer protein (PITP) [Peltula sp. TS41687]|nr:MAG: Non-classical phosphatidylinositol transfer protein (PITP) [Peltula sp. TS41687]
MEAHQASPSTEPEAVLGAGTSAERPPSLADTKDVPSSASQAAAPAATSASTLHPTAQPPRTDTTAEPTWPPLPATHPLRKLQDKLPEILSTTGHAEVWGVYLSGTAPIPFSTTLVLQKFLRANANDVDKAAKQLQETLVWRKEFQPLKAAEEEVFDETRFGGLGYVTLIERKGAATGSWGRKDVVEGAGGKKDKKVDVDVVTWNIYGAVKDPKGTFGDLDGFLRYRVALMERSIAHLHLNDATQPIPDYNSDPNSTAANKDPYQIMQVHDYLSVKFLRMDAATRAASQRTIALFQARYPELLARKFFVNVPFVMGWLFAAMKVFVAKETTRKLVMLTYGNRLVEELGVGVPRAYGGRGEELGEVGETVRLGRLEGEKKEGAVNGQGSGEGEGKEKESAVNGQGSEEVKDKEKVGTEVKA